jgi:hypothetical protein
MKIIPPTFNPFDNDPLYLYVLAVVAAKIEQMAKHPWKLAAAGVALGFLFGPLSAIFIIVWSVALFICV